MNIEQKFEQFRATCNQNEFNDVEFLARASSLQEKKDPELAKRIKQRIKNLQRQTRNNSNADSLWPK